VQRSSYVDVLIYVGRDPNDMHRAASFLEQSYCARCSLVVCTLGSRGALMLFKDGAGSRYQGLWERVRGFYSPCISPQLPHIPVFLPPLEGTLFETIQISNEHSYKHRHIYPLEMMQRRFTRDNSSSQPETDECLGSISYSAIWCAPLH
jgi:hypothetical protein